MFIKMKSIKRQTNMLLQRDVKGFLTFLYVSHQTRKVKLHKGIGTVHYILFL